MLNNDSNSAKPIIEKIPTISVVLNVYNEEEIISKCLSYIRGQDYPQEKIEIILVDDDSTDNTIKIAKKFNVTVVRSGFKNIERAKSVGIGKASGELILFMDADVFLINKQFLKKSVELLLEYPEAVAVQNIRWRYEKKDFIANRYCNLFGINDPLVFFLKKRGTLMAIEDEWPYKDTVVKETEDYVLARYTTKNLPTVGAQGYLARKKNILKTSWKPYFFHLDTALEMVEMGDNEFIMIKTPIEHRYVNSFREYFDKLSRNLKLFLELRKYRKYDYDISPINLIKAVLLMTTIIVPVFQSVRGYLKKPDIAWFLHPLFCFTVPIMYTFVVIRWRIELLWKKNSIV